MRSPILISVATKSENHVPSVLFTPRLEVEAALGVADALDGRLVNEPAASVASGIVDECAGKARSRALLEDLLHDTLLAAASSDKGDTHSVRNDG